jgi:gliding motility-associated protein GldM
MPIEYFVAKPVIRVTTGNAPTLYKQCGNMVNIDVPSLGTNYNPTFTAKGAIIVPGPKASQPIIIPKENKVEITVSSGGAVLGTEKFDVKPIPKPRYTAKNSTGKEIDLRAGELIRNLSTIRVSAEPEDNFKQEVPKDAVYRIRSMEIILARGSSPVKRETFTNESVDLNAWRNLMKPGDNLVIDVKTVTRRTFEGQDEKVDIKVEIIRFDVKQ